MGNGTRPDGPNAAAKARPRFPGGATALTLALALALAATVASGSLADSAPERSVAGPLRAPGLPLIVARAPSAPRWVAVLRAAGAASRIGTVTEGIARGALVAPAGSALSDADARRFVVGGGRLVTSEQRLLRAVGFARAPRTSTDGVVERGVAGRVRWTSRLWIVPLRTSPSLRSVRRIAWSGGSTVAASARLGRGRVLGLGIDPFEGRWGGWEALPLLGREIASFAAAPPGPERPAVEMYLDPAAVAGSTDELAARLVGVRTVLLAGWNTGFVDPAFDFGYRAMIESLHARGIRVYAWLEPPFVNLGLWTAHPECREKDSSGHDAVDDWRALIALEDDRCYDLAWGVWRDLLTRFDFDGVDIAELYYRSPAIPYSTAALAQFGLDPARNAEQWLTFRKELVARLSGKIVESVRSLAKPLDIELTVIDDQLDPELASRIGSDVSRLARVARDAGASLQVEDPYTTWTRGPARYTALSKLVTPLLPSQRVFFDINVVRRDYPYPTQTMAGGELDLSLANAGRVAGRVALYSVATLGGFDVRGLGSALAGTATTGDGTVSAPWSVVVRSPRANLGVLHLDGKRWPSAHGAAIIPAGRHVVSWGPGEDTRPALLRLSGDLLAARSSATGLDFTYTSSAAAWAVVERSPVALTVDGRPATIEQVVAASGELALRLPQGRHVVQATFALAR